MRLQGQHNVDRPGTRRFSTIHNVIKPLSMITQPQYLSIVTRKRKESELPEVVRRFSKWSVINSTIVFVKFR